MMKMMTGCLEVGGGTDYLRYLIVSGAVEVSNPFLNRLDHNIESPPVMKTQIPERVPTAYQSS